MSRNSLRILTSLTWVLLLICAAAIFAGPTAGPTAGPPDPSLPDAAPSTDEARPGPVVVGYLPSWRMTDESVDADRLAPVTDLVYFSLEVPARGTIPLDAVDADHAAVLVSLKRQIGCRTLVCVGGWERSEGFAGVTADAAKRARLVRSLLAICRHYGFDGVDYDWEHPQGPAQLEGYAALIEQTAQAFAEHGLIVTVAQAGWQDLGKRAYTALDRVHLMSYDHAFPQATIEHARQDVARLIQWGCPAEKIALGLPFYGRNAARESRSYAALVGDIADWDHGLDQHAGYAFNGPKTIEAKTRFAMDQGLAGVMIWELTQDVSGPHSLLAAIDRVMEQESRRSE